MHEIHYSGISDRNPSINLKVYIINISFDNIKEIYKEL